MRRAGVAAVLAGVLLLTACASGAQTEHERKAEWADALSSTIAEDSGNDDGSTVSVGTGFVLVTVQAGSGSDWSAVESELRAAVAALSTPPYNSFESRIYVSSGKSLRWDLYHPDDLDTTLAATRVWYEARAMASEESVIDGDTVQFYLETDADPAMQKADLTAALTAAKIDVGRSTIVVTAG